MSNFYGLCAYVFDSNLQAFDVTLKSFIYFVSIRFDFGFDEKNLAGFLQIRLADSFQDLLSLVKIITFVNEFDFV
jgi:hypothetical protein